MKKLQAFLVLPLLSLSVLMASPSSVKNLTITTQHEGCEMFPANNLRFPINPRAGHMSVGVFNSILAKITSLMRQMPEQVQIPDIRIVPMWENPEVNAYATITEFESAPGVQKNQRIIAMFGGLARHPLMTVDGYALVACHEIGHHFGGYPAKQARWAAAEGEADYYGTAKCLRVVFAGENNVELMSRRPVDMTARLKCNHAFPNDREEAAICMRSAMAGIALGNTLASLAPTPPKLALNTPEKEVVTETNVSYPSEQCRLDTYFRGALCPTPTSIPMSFNNPNQGGCNQRSVYDFASRPVCWFKN